MGTDRCHAIGGNGHGNVGLASRQISVRNQIKPGAVHGLACIQAGSWAAEANSRRNRDVVDSCAVGVDARGYDDCLADGIKPIWLGGQGNGDNGERHR
ncbi:hypothetical protein D3C87_1882170 [compost metagenome]